jgi:hypothetical protein
MNRLTTVARWAVLGALSSLAGCSGGTPAGTFIIVQNQVPNNDCTIPATLGTVYSSQGLVDVRLAQGYWLFPLLQNDFPGPVGTAVDGNRIALSGFDVDIEPAPGVDDAVSQMITALRPPDGPISPLVQFSALTSGSVASGGGNTSSSVNVLPGGLQDMLRGTNLSTHAWIIASVRARGGNLGLGTVRSDAFRFPIEVCDGCLIHDQGVCSTDTGAPAVCNLGQDDVVGCCEQAGQFVCPAVTLK